jgi:hypothetical protein
MRRVAIPIIASLLLCFAWQSASAQQATGDTLDAWIGFGGHLGDTLGVWPGDTIEIPIFLQTDSTVTGVSAVIWFDKDMLWPVIAYQPRYQRMLDSLDSLGLPPDLATDSADFTIVDGVYSPGLWDVECGLTSNTQQTWGDRNGYIQALHNLNSPDTLRVIMAPKTGQQGDTILPYIPKNFNNGNGAPIAWVRFWVNPAVDSGSLYTVLRYIRSTPDYIMTELAQNWYTGGVDPETRQYLPSRRNSIFVTKPDSADTGGGGPGPGPTENKPPVLTLGTSETVFSIKQGEQVSFTVTATDVEGGEVQITANGGNLPANANLAPSNPAVGGGGTVTATFSFKPDVTQQGAFAFTFVAQDDSGATSGAKAVTVNVAELDIDRLFTASNDSLVPEGGVPGLPEVLVPINVVSKKTIYGVQYDMKYDATNFDLDSIFTSDRIPDWIVYDNIGATPGSVRVVTFGLANDPMVTGSSSAILYMAFTVDDYAKIGGYPLVIDSGWESIDPDPNVPSLELVTAGGVLYVDRWGDVNLDRRINVADLVNVVGYIIGNYGLSRRQFATADIVINDTVNVVDLVGIINTIFGWPVTPAPSAPWQGDYAMLKIYHDEVPGAGMESEMQINADMPASVAGVELDIQYNPGSIDMLPPMLSPQLPSGPNGFQLSWSDDGNGHMKVLIYSSRPWDENELISEGLSNIVRLPFISKGPIAATDNGLLKITKAFVSTGGAKNIPVEGVGGPSIPTTFALFQNRPNPFNPNTTIDFNINGSEAAGGEHVTLEVFNLLGQLVKTLVDEQLPTGQHSVVWDGTDKYGHRAASGIYLYRLRVGDDSQTKKMMLLK